MRTTSEKLYKHICTKYPNIEYKGEDLNLDNLYAKEVFKRWQDTDNYSLVADISNELKISERTIYRLAKEHKMGNRWQIHKLNK